MRVFFIRHGETEHNIAGLLAGSTDSRLTVHGSLQAERLADHLIKKRNLNFSQVFASDLQRAHRTANEICNAQNAATPKDHVISTIVLPVLREQDFGSFELLAWGRTQDARRKELSQDPNFKPKETKIALKARADVFLDDYLLPLLAIDEESEQFVAVVSHGLFLAAIWRALLLRFRPGSVSFSTEVSRSISSRPLEYLATFSNTGVLELQITPCPAPATEPTSANPSTEPAAEPSHLDATLKIHAVNSKEHLTSLKRTRGGVGSSASDENQRRVDSFFKKRKLDDTESVSSAAPAKRVK